jgi:hypothetical protein
MDPVSPILRTMCRYLEGNELFHAFTGELALRMLGMCDAVRTVELTVNLTPEERSKLLNFLEQEGFVVEDPMRGHVSMRHRVSGLGLRLRMAGSAAEMAAIGRRVPVTLDFQTFFIPATEDLLLGIIQDRDAPRGMATRLYAKWRNYVDMEYLVASARSRGIYDRFIKMKRDAER